nr:hypothetical protein Iba_chr05aCG8190 [Ipomoea batatas]GME21546.1 hypothetical protein Iba_scaffold28248CG0010 [Ipomoea batatas]
MLPNHSQSFTELRLYSRRCTNHQRNNQTFDLLFLRVRNWSRGGSIRSRRRRRPSKLEVILKVHSGRLSDLLINRRLSHEAEHDEAVVELLSGLRESRLSLAPRLGHWR